MLRSLFRTLGLLAALAACAPLGGGPSAAATSLVLPTLTAAASPTAFAPLASTASLTPEPSQTPSPAVASETPVPLPTLELAPTPLPTDIPQPAAGSGAIQILSPGPLSKVVSTVKAYGYAVPGADEKGRIELFGEDGRLLAWQDLQLLTPIRWAYFYWELPFQLTSAGELGRLSFSTRDRYGRLTALNSVRLLLFPQGFSLIYPPGSLQERCVLERPLGGQRITGGNLTVQGEIRPYNSMPLSVELIARDGQVVGSQLVPVTPSAGDAYLPFRVDVAYTVAGPTDALLTISQSDDRIAGRMYVFTQPAFINP